MSQRVVPPCIVLVVITHVVACRHSEPPTTVAVPSGGVTLEGAAVPTDGRMTVDALLDDGGQVSIALTNGTDDIVMLRRGLGIEQFHTGEWVELEGIGDLWIRSECALMDDVQFPEGLGEHCFGLSAGTRVVVVPWFGTFGDAQCSCERCSPVPEGTYRIVAYGCDGERYESAPLAYARRGFSASR